MIGEILSYGIAGLVGFLTGVTVQFGYLKAHGKRIVLPFISNSSRTITLAAIGLALLSLFTIVQVERSDQERTSCQVQFQTALAYNTDLNKQETALRDRERAAQAEYDDATGDLIFEVAELIRDEPRDVMTNQAPFTKFIDRRNAVTLEKDAIDQERQANQQDRKPYPTPTCGMQ